METTVNNYKKRIRTTNISFKECAYWENGTQMVNPTTGLPMMTECLILKGVDASLTGADLLLCEDVFTVATVLKPETVKTIKATVKLGDQLNIMTGIIEVSPFHRIMNGNIICNLEGVPKVYNSILVQRLWSDTISIEQVALKMREDGIKKGQMCEISVPEPEPVAPTPDPVTGAAPAQPVVPTPTQPVAQRRPF